MPERPFHKTCAKLLLADGLELFHVIDLEGSPEGLPPVGRGAGEGLAPGGGRPVGQEDPDVAPICQRVRPRKGKNSRAILVRCQLHSHQGCCTLYQLARVREVSKVEHASLLEDRRGTLLGGADDREGHASVLQPHLARESAGTGINVDPACETRVPLQRLRERGLQRRGVRPGQHQEERRVGADLQRSNCVKDLHVEQLHVVCLIGAHGRRPLGQH
mmetsp:Transcript_84331/g.239022  ORF Transcript_84331/g.239022 Transcript_84331/m.239022 type:complete len:217 (+) Transcript_84331:859-1509(+)